MRERERERESIRIFSTSGEVINPPGAAVDSASIETSPVTRRDDLANQKHKIELGSLQAEHLRCVGNPPISGTGSRWWPHRPIFLGSYIFCLGFNA